MMKKLIAFVLFLLLLSFPAQAENAYLSENEKEEISASLDSSTLQFLEDNGITPDSEINTLTAENLFSHLWSFVKSGGRLPLRAFWQIAAVLLLAALSAGVAEQKSGKTVEFVCTAGCLTALTVPLYSFLLSSVSFLKNAAVFMTALTPFLSAGLVCGGKAATGAAVGGILPAAASAVSLAASFVVLPLMSAYLAVGVCSALTPKSPFSAICDTVRKVGFWVLSFVLTVYLGLLSIKGNLAGAADGLGMKTAKFFLGTAVPVAGSALSETVSAVMGGLSVLKGSICFYGIAALAAFLLPIIIELLLWRLCLLGVTSVGRIFSLERVGAAAGVLDTMLSLLLSLFLFCFALFTISLGTVMRL